MDKWKPPTKEEREANNRALLLKIRKDWEKSCKHNDLDVPSWDADKLLSEAREALEGGEAKSIAQAAEHIRLRIAYQLLQNAIEANIPDMQSANSDAESGMRIQESDVRGREVTLCFFSGTKGERVFMSPEGLKLPSVEDPKHYTSKTNRYIREAMKQVFPGTQNEDGQGFAVRL